MGTAATCDFCSGSMPSPSPSPLGIAVATVLGLARRVWTLDLCATCEELLTAAELRRLIERKIAADRETNTVRDPIDRSQGKPVG